MKKVLIVVAVMFIVVASFGRSADSKKGGAAQSPFTDSTKINAAAVKSYTNMTLNGITKDSAMKLIENYNNSPKVPVPAGSFFFNKDLLKKVVKVLSEEQSKDSNVDGLRIYFGRETVNEPEVQLIMVATRKYDLKDTEKTHDDYYDHGTPAADELYKPGNTDFAIPFFLKRTIKGTVLDSTCSKGCADDLSCDFNRYPQFLQRAVAEKMVARYGINKQRTKAEWFSLATLQLLLSDPATSGIRGYLARRPVDTQSKDSDKDCIIFTTTKSAGHYYQDYFDCKTLIQEFEKTHPIVPPPLNNGELCPNNCN